MLIPPFFPYENDNRHTLMTRGTYKDSSKMVHSNSHPLPSGGLASCGACTHPSPSEVPALFLTLLPLPHHNSSNRSIHHSSLELHSHHIRGCRVATTASSYRSSCVPAPLASSPWSCMRSGKWSNPDHNLRLPDVLPSAGCAADALNVTPSSCPPCTLWRTCRSPGCTSPLRARALQPRATHHTHVGIPRPDRECLWRRCIGGCELPRIFGLLATHHYSRSRSNSRRRCCARSRIVHRSRASCNGWSSR